MKITTIPIAPFKRHMNFLINKHCSKCRILLKKGEGSLMEDYIRKGWGYLYLQGPGTLLPEVASRGKIASFVQNVLIPEMYAQLIVLCYFVLFIYL